MKVIDNIKDVVQDGEGKIIYVDYYDCKRLESELAKHGLWDNAFTCDLWNDVPKPTKCSVPLAIKQEFDSTYYPAMYYENIVQLSQEFPNGIAYFPLWSNLKDAIKMKKESDIKHWWPHCGSSLEKIANTSIRDFIDILLNDYKHCGLTVIVGYDEEYMVNTCPIMELKGDYVYKSSGKSELEVKYDKTLQAYDDLIEKYQKEHDRDMNYKWFDSATKTLNIIQHLVRKRGCFVSHRDDYLNKLMKLPTLTKLDKILKEGRYGGR